MIRWLARWLLALLLAVVVDVGPATAGKLIGVVFDDSGSMQPSYNLPLLGLQMLTATLEGNVAGDRLLITRMDGRERSASEFGNGARLGERIWEIPLGPDEATLQRSVDAYSTWTIRAGAGTPYRPIDDMLAALKDLATPGQEVHLIVFTDGFFAEDPVMAGAEERFRALRRALDAVNVRLQVHFLLILNTGAAEIEANVKRQKIRSSLLAVFNGDAEAGSYRVDSFDQLRQVMLGIIVRVSGTDAQRSSSVITRHGDTVDIALPFAVSRVIALTAGRPTGDGDGACAGLADAGDPSRPVPRPTGIDGVDAVRVTSCGRMAHADTLEAWRNGGRWGFVANQFFPKPYLQPGRHTLRFDRPIGADTVLLFRTDLSVGWSLSNGEEVVRSDVVGTEPPTIAATGDLTLDVFVRDRLDGGRISSFEDFPKDARFSARVGGPEGTRTVALGFDATRTRVTGTISRLEPGPHTLEVEMVVAGAQSQSSGRIAFEFRRRAEFEMAIDPGRRDGRRFAVDTSAGSPAAATRLTTVTLSAKNGTAGRAKLEVADLPEGLEAIHDGASLPAAGKVVDFAGGRPIRFDLVRTDRWTGLGADRAALAPQVVVRATEIPSKPGGRAGTLEATIDVAVVIPEARLTPIREGSEAADAPRTIAVARLPSVPEAGSPRLEFLLENAVVSPEPVDFAVSASGFAGRFATDPTVAVGPRPGTRVVAVRLAAGLCGRCLLGLGAAGAGAIDLAYRGRGGQSAVATFPLALDPADGAATGACVEIGLWLLALIWAVGTVISALIADTFPKRSIVMVEQARRNPVHSGLAHGGTLLLAAAWPARLLALRRFRIRQTAAREGLMLTAASGGVEITPVGRGWPGYKSEHNGLTLEQQSPVQPGGRTSPIFLTWGSVLIDRDRRRVIGVYESRAASVARWPELFER